jgi:hypothetical protein
MHNMYHLIQLMVTRATMLSQRIHATNIQKNVSQMRAREKTFDAVTGHDIDDDDPESTIGVLKMKMIVLYEIVQNQQRLR